jgi:DNA-binding transcriptional MerR regulator
MDNTWPTIAEAAAQTGIAVSTLHYARKAGLLRCDRRGTGRNCRYFVDPQSLAAYRKIHTPHVHKPKDEAQT